MTTRSAAPFAGVGWLKDSFALIAKRPGTLVGAGLLMFLLMMLPSAITISMQLAMPGSKPVFYFSVALALVAGVLMVPLYGGYLQMIDRIERAETASFLDILRPYRDRTALPLIGFGLWFMVLFIVMLFAIVAALGGSLAQWYAAAAVQQSPAAIPEGFWTIFASMMVLSYLFMGVTAIGYGQIALNGRGPLAALRDGAVGTIKNIVPLLVLTLAGVVLAIGVTIVVVILVGLLTLLAKSIALLVVIPLYLALILLVYPLMFGVMYSLWRDVCGQDRAVAANQTLA